MAFAPIMMKLDLQKEISEQLNIEEIFSFKLGSVTLGFDEGTVVSWIIMAVITLLAILLTRNLKVEGKLTKRQLLLEMCYSKMESFFKELLGEEGKGYIPWLMSTAIFIGASNMIGIFGFKPPTKSMQVTAALAATSIFLTEFAGIKAKGIGGHLKAFTQPVAIVTPINLLELIIKPLSLCMRLFGNIIGAFIIMELLKAVVPLVLPMVFSLYFDLFDGFLQAYVFVFLTSLYIREAVEPSEPMEKKPKKQKKQKKQKKPADLEAAA